MRRRRAKSSDNDDFVVGLFELFRSAPWYVGPITAFLIYLLLAGAVPWFCPPVTQGDSFKNKKPIEFFLFPIGMMAKVSAPYICGILLAISGFAQAAKLGDRNRLEHLKKPNDIKDLCWQDFERLLCEAFRRQGYSVEHSGRNGADGRVDIRLHKGKQLSLVQCKHWKKWQVGVSIIREMLGLVTSERAQWGIVVTSGTFTPDAIEFARNNSVQLIDGEELDRLISSVRI